MDQIGTSLDLGLSGSAMYSRYDPHYLILPQDLRQHEPTFTEIWTAIMRHDLDRLKNLANNMPLNRVTDAHHNTVVHLSAMYSNERAMKYILTQRQDRPDVNAPNIFGTTALHVALDRVQSDRYTEVNQEVLWLLLDAGADLRVLNGLGNSGLDAVSSFTCCTTIFKAYETLAKVEHDKLELAKTFVQAGWPLKHFFWTKDLELIRKVIEYAPEKLRISDNPNSTPMRDALEARASVEVFKLLLEFGVSPNAPIVGNRNTPLHDACELSGKWDNLEIVRILLDAGADPNARNSVQCTCFHTAVTFGSPDVIKLLLDRGADVHALDEMRNTMLHFAAFKGNVEILAMLIERGLQVNKKTMYDVTPLHMASRKGRADATEYLLKQGANIHMKDLRGWTALHYAVQSCTCDGPMHECVDTVDVLVDHGAELDIEKPEEKSALALCIDNKNIPFSTFLIRSLAMLEPRNVDARARTIQLIEKNRTLKEYYDRCVKEIKSMKKRMVYGEVSFYRALTCPQDQLRRLLRNPEYVDAMNKLIHCGYINEYFLIYRYRLIGRYMTAMAVQGPINDATEALCYLLCTPDRTNEVIMSIVKFLGKDELKVLSNCKLVIEQELQENNDDPESS